MINKVFKLIQLPGLCFIYLLFSSTCLAQQQVVMLVPSETQEFWKLAIRFSKAAAHDLDINLEIIKAENRFDKRKAFIEVINRVNKVDAIVVKIEYENESRFLELAEQTKTALFTFNTGFDKQKLAKSVGMPRENYLYWLGEIIPNETQTSTLTTRILFDEARRKKLLDKRGHIQLVAISAEKDSHPNDERMQGFEDVLNSSEDTILHQTVYSNWKEKRARFAFAGLMKRYPQTKVVWTVSRDWAVRSKAKELGLIPGKDFVINSNSFHQQTLSAVKSGEVAVAAGGHYVDGAWVMVLLHDYFQGRDFAEEDVQILTKMAIVTQQNVDDFLPKMTRVKLSTDNIEKIDFGKFSKVKNPELKTYQFSLNSILDRL